MNRREDKGEFEKAGNCMNLEEWQTRVDSIDLGGIRLYHAYAFNEKTRQVIEGDMEDTDEEFVRTRFQQQLIGTLVQMDVEESMRAKDEAKNEERR